MLDLLIRMQLYFFHPLFNINIIETLNLIIKTFITILINFWNYIT